MNAAITLIDVQIHVPSGSIMDRRPESKEATIHNGKKYLRAGMINTFDPKDTLELEKYRAAVKTACRSVGVKIMHMWAIPHTRLPELETKLNALRDEFKVAAQVFVDEFPQRVSDWANASGNDEIRDLVISHAASQTKISRDIRFDYWAFNVESVSDQCEGGAEAAVQDSLLHEICVDANQIWRKSLKTATTKTRKIFSPFRRIRDKVEGLIVLDKGLQNVVDHIDSVLDSMPKEGAIEGDALVSLKRLCRELADAEGMRQTIMPDLANATSDSQDTSPVEEPEPVKRKGLALEW